MTNKTKDQIKVFFTTGSKPNQSQFIDLIDSYVDRSGPVGTIESACSAGSTGVIVAAAGVPSIASYAAVLASQGVTVYTTALSNSATLGLAATTAQAVAGTDNSTIMTPVLVKNAITGQGSSEIVLLGTGTAANSATLDFTSLISSSYSEYYFVFESLLYSTTAHLIAFHSVNNGSTWSADSNYAQMSDYTITGTSAPALTSQSNAASLNLSTDNSSSQPQSGHAVWQPQTKSNMWNSTVGYVQGAHMADVRGNLGDGTTSVNAIRFAPSAGNITSGKIYMYGRKNT